MRRSRIPLLLVLAAFSVGGVCADIAGDQVRVIYAPRPEYPLAARRVYNAGSGVFRLNLDGRGGVKSITIVKSTGVTRLDLEAMKAFVRWRTAPTKTLYLDVPVKFTMGESHPSVGAPSHWNSPAINKTTRPR